MKAKADVKMQFRNSYCRWLVECNKPLTTGSSLAFKMMIKILNGKVVVPERRDVLNLIDLKRLSSARQKIKELIGSKYFRRNILVVVLGKSYKNNFMRQLIQICWASISCLALSLIPQVI